ncbi:NUDIX domain-containing protein [Patescibacteria group bacterium]
MTKGIPQFGEKPKGKWEDRKSVYAIVLDDGEKLLVLKVRGVFHLPGGGIEEDEDPEEAVVREAMEEAGATITSTNFIGRANQFFPDHNLNKVGTFYSAKLVEYKPDLSPEDDHQPEWIDTQVFMDGPVASFQKWAVQKYLKEK